MNYMSDTLNNLAKAQALRGVSGKNFLQRLAAFTKALQSAGDMGVIPSTILGMRIIRPSGDVPVQPPRRDFLGDDIIRGGFTPNNRTSLV